MGRRLSQISAAPGKYQASRAKLGRAGQNSGGVRNHQDLAVKIAAAIETHQQLVKPTPSSPCGTGGRLQDPRSAAAVSAVPPRHGTHLEDGAARPGVVATPGMAQLRARRFEMGQRFFAQRDLAQGLSLLHELSFQEGAVFGASCSTPYWCRRSPGTSPVASGSALKFQPLREKLPT
jgi:hypothetical protein